ncbi:MAG TPA: serine/threonine-protein kinase [Planctomycetota bacterium]|jgi:serine/threonine protein kinase/DNA-directed RNA polymerase subunit RPC12/RpoP|nr:serine/threonine-protein kinase [Planctomycetota bacterium]
MSTGRGDLLLGKIALREGLVTKEQLFDCLQAQERNPSRSLGSILISRGYLRQEDVDRLVRLQKQAFETDPSSGAPRRRGPLFGKILVDRGLATEYQVNECLRLQGRMAELGIQPVPALGEILIRRGYLDREAVETALQLQNLELYTCPDCGAPLEGGPEPDPSGQTYACRACGARVPPLLAKMATALKEALEEASREHDVDLPEEVRRAAADASKRFGKYVLIREIGRGGAGIVYKAWQQDLNKIVALKILPHESDTAAGVKTPFGDVEDVKRFYNETRAHAELQHPNIVPILDFGVVDDHFYYTMTYIEGVTLDGVVREGLDERAFQTTFIPSAGEPAPPRRETARIVKGKGMPLRKALEILRDLALAVQYAHERGVYHRDIKPANIILDKDGKPWLMDFGLAKVTRIGDSAYVKGVIMGTPYYMPPEQAIGDMEQVDDRSDIYSLGAVLYEMVSGYCPFTGKTPDEVLALLPKQPPEPVRSHVPQLPEEVAAIIEKAMRREKHRRYPSARALAEDIENYLAGRPLNLEPQGARPSSLWGKIRGLFGGD